MDFFLYGDCKLHPMLRTALCYILSTVRGNRVKQTATLDWRVNANKHILVTITDLFITVVITH